MTAADLGRGIGAGEIEIALSSLRHVHVLHGLQRHAHEEAEPFAFGLEKGLHDDRVRDVVRDRADRRRDDQCESDRRDKSHPHGMISAVEPSS